jgi:polyisoprenoid-binding protein YceI
MHRGLPGIIAVAALSIGLAAPASAATYKIDKDHSSIGFKIRHLVSKVPGSFNDFEGAFVYAPDQPEQWNVNAKVNPASIDTNVEQRDKHLRSPDFFDVEKYPEMTFVSTKVTDVTKSSAKLHGDLTMHGVTKPVVLDLRIHGEGKDPWGNTRAGFTATTTINRKDFGLGWNQALETGQLLVGEDVDITLDIEGIAESQGQAGG